MEKRKLTPGEWGVEASQFVQIKELLISWMKPAPSREFLGCDEAPCLPNNEKAWKYKPRYIKTCYLRGLRNLRHISEIPYYLSFINRSEFSELLILFLCSQMAMKNAKVVQQLIDYVDDGDYARQLALNYEELLRGGLEKLYWYNRFDGEKEYIANLIKPVKPEERLREVECYHMLEILHSDESIPIDEIHKLLRKN